MKTEESASFLERGETNMVSHRPRKRTWTNQKKENQRRKNLGEKNQWTLSSTEGQVYKNMPRLFLIFAQGLRYDLSKISDNFTPFFRLSKAINSLDKD